MEDITYLVGMGGSAGALEGYEALLRNLPTTTGMAFVIVAHLSPKLPSHLAEILSRSTRMPVRSAVSGMAVEKNNVYVISPNTDLEVTDGHLRVSSPRTIKNGRHQQVDLFFGSIANTFGKRAIGIILSGGDGDGTEGCRLIKQKGGMTFAQDLSDAPVNSMPFNAFKSGSVDLILSTEEIARKLVNLPSGDAFSGIEASTL
jgi:two-component system CheB/CheR fusion protein